MPRKKKFKADPDALYDVEKIVDIRKLKKNTRIFTQYLVKWKGYSEEKNTWIYMSNLSKTLIEEFEERNPSLVKQGPSSITVVEANSAATQAGPSSSITVVQTNTSATQAGPDNSIGQVETAGAVTRSATRSAVIQNVDKSRQDKSTQTSYYVFEKYNYKL